ncbi:MAG: 4-hydroxythreonine-4-phosphate dehydrogenase PdxA [Ignavibacteriales bacterium]
MNRIIITCGDVNGIGPEIILKSITNPRFNNKQFLVIIPQNVFEKTASLVNFNHDFSLVKKISDIKGQKKNINIIALSTVRINPGRPTIISGETSFKALMTAKELLSQDISNILVTAPISKESFELSKINFPGHTELLASWFSTENYLMTFISNTFKAALLTIHESIAKVPKLITKSLLKKKLDILYNSIKFDFAETSPQIAVLGLNPHSGENGRIGHEDISIIKPFIENYFPKIIDGPFVPDAFFANKLYRNYDFTLGMYHDQILIPFKLINFNSGVNFTAGLPIIRTSPDHGTAFDIAWQNKANESSMVEAIKWALKIKSNRLKYSHEG